MLIRIPVTDSATLFKYWDPAAPMPSMMAELDRDPRSSSEKEGYHAHPRFYWSMAPIPYPDGYKPSSLRWRLPSQT